ncbi:hypothetical protein ACN20G_11735 [Streptomyces sp. BI20]|uniref:hypothetical protein n=1 Tax=Streptomyces sp. BI20 TaxID=3403460 RepID=UPI003C74414D
MTDLVYDHSRSRLGARLVLLALAHHADGRGVVTLSAREVADMTGLTDRSVFEGLKVLREAGEVKRTEHGRGHAVRNTYQLSLGPLADVTFSEPSSINREEASASVRGVQRSSDPEPASRTRVGGTPFGSTPHNKQASKLGSGSIDVPDGARPLVDAMEAAGMTVGWRLTLEEWKAVQTLVARWGVARLVDLAARRWKDPARRPQSARYLVRIWSDLPAITPPANVVPLRVPTARAYVDPVSTDVYGSGF